MGQIIWTIQSVTATEKGRIYGPMQSFVPKKAAVAALLSQRQPKTEILRFGHHYQFTPHKDR